MSSLFKKQTELVLFLIFGRRIGCDQPEWGPVGELGITLKDRKNSPKPI